MSPNAGKHAKNDTDCQGVLVVGCGYLGSRVAAAVKQSGDKVWTTTRSEQRASQWKQSGFEPIVLDWTDRRTLQSIPQVNRLLVAVSYDRTSQLSRHESQVGGLQNLLAKISPSANVCYISTTGVFHQTDGQWVDENSPAEPTREGGRAHLDAESALRECRGDAPWSILRLSGIYGPDRVPRAADVIAGRPIRSPQEGYLNLIHVDDAVQAVLASWQRQQQRLYLISDDKPVVRRDFYQEIAVQCNAEAPTFEPPDSDAPVSMRSNSNKRIRNQRMKQELVSELQYPTYRDGLRDVLSNT